MNSINKIGIWALIVLCSLCCHTLLSAQELVRYSGTNCVDATNEFEVGPDYSDCTITQWLITGNTNYTILSSWSTGAAIRWNGPGSAAVSAICNCPGRQVGDLNYAGQINISEPWNLSVSLTSTATTVCSNTSVTFTAAGNHGNGTPFFTWYINGVHQRTTTTNKFTRSSWTNGDVVSVTLDVSTEEVCVVGSGVESNGITMNVTQVTPISVTINEPAPVCWGSPIAFQATPSPNAVNPTFKWFRNGVEVTDNHHGGSWYAGSSYFGGETIYCRMTASGTCLENNVASSKTVTVSTYPRTKPNVMVAANHIAFCEGEEITFTASPLGDYTLSGFQWKLNSVSVPNNTTSTFKTTQFTTGSVVTVTASVNGDCLSEQSVSGTSANFHPITIKPKPLTQISPSGTKKICSTCPFQINASPVGPDYSYEWLANGNVIPGETGPSFSPSSSNETSYTAKVTRFGCSRTSDPLVFSKNIRPIANAGENQNFRLPQNSITLTGSGFDADGSITSYKWTQLSGQPATVAGYNTQQLSLSNLTIGTYVFQLVVIDNFGEESLPSQVTVTVEPPANNYNYIKETSVTASGKTDVNQLSTLSAWEKSISWNYFDGLGRPMQSVQVQGSPLGNDIVQPIIYDEYGRERFKYLPYVAADKTGWYKINPVGTELSYSDSPQSKFYNNELDDKIKNDAKPYAETVFEPSPLNRVVKQGSPGQAWQPNYDPASMADNTVKKIYRSNTTQEVLLFYYDAASGLLSLSSNANQRYYSPNELFANSTYDEHSNEVIEYTDKEGKVVCKKVQHSTGQNNTRLYASTYYIYDDYGNLALVLPPEAIRNIE